jgi:hypothetical protein
MAAVFLSSTMTTSSAKSRPGKRGWDVDNQETDDRGKVVELAGWQAVRTAVHEPPLSNAERREMREMLAYYRKARPQFEALKRGCPTARHLLED